MSVQTVNTSDKLETYSISKRAIEILAKHDKATKHAATGGRTLPGVIHLFRPDFVDIDAAVRQQSKGAQNARTVTWRGRGLAPV